MANVKIPRKNITKIQIIEENLTGEQIYAKYKPDYLINGALYDMGSGKNITFLKSNKGMSGYLFSDEGLAVENNKELTWIKKSNINNNITSYISGSPTLVKDGKRNVNWGNKVSTVIQGKHKRSIIGFNNDSLFLICTDNSITIEEEVSICLKMGMTYSLNLDGGGSSHLAEKGKVLTRSIRKNASWILVYTGKNEEKPTPTKPVQPQNPTNKIEYVVQKGDSLSKIAQKFGVNYKDIAKDNNIADPSKIRVGQRLIINK